MSILPVVIHRKEIRHSMIWVVAVYFLIICVFHLSSVNSHGRLMEPPGRSSLWRFPEFKKYSPEVNYNDNELFCGGAYIQHGRNKGKCGECGDPYHMRRPRDNEARGKYGKGIITRKYSSGQLINVAVEITASHHGDFEFRLCPQNNPLIPVHQSCLDRFVLPTAASGTTKHAVNRGIGWYNTTLALPKGLRCWHCVLQWNYRAANSWGQCGNGTGAVGCGPQETFRSCSDISIQ